MVADLILVKRASPTTEVYSEVLIILRPFNWIERRGGGASYLCDVYWVDGDRFVGYLDANSKQGWHEAKLALCVVKIII